MSFEEYVSRMKAYLKSQENYYTLELKSLSKCDLTDHLIRAAYDACVDIIDASQIAYIKFEFVVQSTDDNNKIALIQWDNAYNTFKLKKMLADNAIANSTYV